MFRTILEEKQISKEEFIKEVGLDFYESCQNSIINIH